MDILDEIGRILRKYSNKPKANIEPVKSFKYKWTPYGARFHIDGIQFDLTPQPARALVILAADITDGGSGLVAFKSAKAVCKWLHGENPEVVEPHSVETLIWRLRDVLFTHGLSRDLIESHRGKGYRLKIEKDQPFTPRLKPDQPFWGDRLAH